MATDPAPQAWGYIVLWADADRDWHMLGLWSDLETARAHVLEVPCGRAVSCDLFALVPIGPQEDTRDA